MSSKPSSLEAAARDVFDSEAGGAGLMGAATEAAQLDLLRDKRGNLPANVFTLVRQEPEKARGPGRPKGSRNRAGGDLAKLLATKGYSDPVEFMASLYTMPTDQVVELARIANPGKADKHGNLFLKALNIQLAAAKSVAEYWHSKKPVEAKVEFADIPTIVMPGAAASFAETDQVSRLAGELLAAGLTRGKIMPADIAGLEFRNGQFMVDGKFVDVDDDGDEPQAGQ